MKLRRFAIAPVPPNPHDGGLICTLARKRFHQTADGIRFLTPAASGNGESISPSSIRCAGLRFVAPASGIRNGKPLAKRIKLNEQRGIPKITNRLPADLGIIVRRANPASFRFDGVHQLRLYFRFRSG